MNVTIILRKSGIYDMYDGRGKWMFSTKSADRVFSRLNDMANVAIKFVDETIE